jgi:hypoxanthine-DNA glycosylase
MSPLIRSFPPLYRHDARLLILGSMPGVASLQATAYYAHPHNLFWRFAGEALGFDPALAYADRVAALLDARVALWDVLASCHRPGSLDARIDPASVSANDIASLLQACPGIRRICFNGNTAATLFRRHIQPTLAAPLPELLPLPSTSPANAGMAREQKRAAWLAALTLQTGY